MTNQMSIPKQLLLASIICSALAIIIFVFSYRGLDRAESSLRTVVANSTVLKNHQQADMMHEGLRAEVMRALLVAKDNSGMQEAVKRATHENAAEFRKMIAENRKLLGDGPIKSKLSATEQEMEKYITIAQSLVAQAFNDHAGALRQMDAFDKSFTHLEEKMSGISEFVEDENLKAQKTGTEAATAAMKTIVTVSVISIAILLLVSFIVSRNITAMLEKIRRLGVTVAAASAEGNLTARVEAGGNDEAGILAGHLNKILANFHTAMQEIRDASERLVNVSSEVASVSRDTSTGVKRQQSETEQVATAVTEMAMTVQEIARNSVQAAQAAIQGNEEASKGRRIVAEAIDSMDVLSQQVDRTVEVLQKLKTDSNNIGAVLDVIRSIAEQTNLLALNAAIEAARAGEQGRGFAVVADEVRTLAQRTQQSTREIQEMIQRLQTGVGEVASTMEQGQQQTRTTVEKVSEAGGSLQSITASVGVITDMSTQIATATEEQSKVAEDVNRNIANISNVAEQTATAAQRAAQATEEIAGLSRKLRALVQRFKLG